MRPDDAMFAYASDPEVTRYVLWDTRGSIEYSETFLRFATEGYKKGDVGGLGVVQKARRPARNPYADASTSRAPTGT